MTDREKLCDLLRSFGLQKVELERDTGVGPGAILTLEAKMDPSGLVGGYTGFAVDFKFDDEGKFVRMDIWE